MPFLQEIKPQAHLLRTTNTKVTSSFPPPGSDTKNKPHFTSSRPIPNRAPRDVPTFTAANAPAHASTQDSYGTIGYQIANEISCDMKPNVRNECFCRTDLQFSAHTFVASCVNTWCSKVAADIATATRLYDEYCTANGYVQAAVEAGPPETTVGQPTSVHDRHPRREPGLEGIDRVDRGRRDRTE
ncbi:hypothetical protein PG987_013825 [Apiospora arundinis]